MTESNPTLRLWAKLASLPLGKWMFARLVCFKAPYFASISPSIDDLTAGSCTVRLTKRRKVLNHIGTVHAIAICNMAELAAGVMTDATVPATTHRWIPKGMTVEYVKKAGTDLRAVASVDPIPNFNSAPLDLPVHVTVTDAAAETVFRAVITMWVTPRRP